MKPAQFDYARPTSVVDAVGILAESEECKVLAGGQSLVPVMNFRLAEPMLLVDVNGLDELKGIGEGSGRLRIGAVTRTREVERSPLVAERLPVLAHAAGWVGHVQIRNRGTVGGSIVHGDPSAELPAICVLLGAEMTLASRESRRVVAAEDFFEGLMTTAAEPDELLTDIEFALPSSGSAWGFSEYAQRHGDFALAGVAMLVDKDTGLARVVAFGPSSTPLRCHSAEDVLAGAELSATLASAVADAATADVEAVTAAETPEARHRVQTVRTMARRAFEQCLRRAGEPA